MSKWIERKYSVVRKAKRHGLIPRKTVCEVCGKPSRHNHHEDYKKPLEVTHLCSKCHQARHRQLGWGAPGKPNDYNFAAIPVGWFAFAPNNSVTRIRGIAYYYSKKTGMAFKCFTYNDGVIIFRTK